MSALKSAGLEATAPAKNGAKGTKGVQDSAFPTLAESSLRVAERNRRMAEALGCGKGGGASAGMDRTVQYAVEAQGVAWGQELLQWAKLNKVQYTMHHAPCTMHHAPCTIHHTPCTILTRRTRPRCW
jgi:hypothetical protein